MDQFSISELAKFAGMKPHTIRIWEKRYGALQPVRSEGNTRYYDGEQLRRLLNIVSLKEPDSNLSVLCGYSDEELFKRIKDARTSGLDRGDKAAYFIAQFIASGTSYDEQQFNRIFDAVLEKYTAEDAYTKIFYPLLERVGILWSVDNINAPVEHFISNMLKQKFYALINDIPAPKKKAECWLLFLREGEFHELGLLFTRYILRLSGRKVIYLGPNTPLKPLLQSAEIIQPDRLLFFQVIKEEPAQLSEYLQVLHRSVKIPVLVATSLVVKKQQKGIHYLYSLADLSIYLR